MARVAQATQTASLAKSDDSGGTQTAVTTPHAVPTTEPMDKDKVLPLPEWLKRAYFIFPIVLYIPDAIFNFYVYSDGVHQTGNPLLDGSTMVLWAFVSLGVVGMAYLLSVLAPWHWGQGHRIQAFFCGLGVVIATGITTWNSLSYRSADFTAFNTDKWIYHAWPQLQSLGISVTMVLVSIAPPFWGLFWAIVQPTETGRSLRQIQESHAEKLLRMQQEAELKRIKAETTAKIREAQLRGMAQTAAAAREQAKGIFAQQTKDRQNEQQDTQDGSIVAATSEGQSVDMPSTPERDEQEEGSNVLHYPTFTPSTTRGQTSDRPGTNMYNHAAAAPTVHSAPAAGIAPASQPMLLADVHGSAGMPPSDVASGLPMRTPPVIGKGIQAFFPTDASELDGMTGTTGPRPAIRRPGEGTFLRTMNEPQLGRVGEAVQAVVAELSARGDGKRPTQREVVVGVAQRLNIDETTAKTAVRKWQEMRRAARD